MRNPELSGFRIPHSSLPLTPLSRERPCSARSESRERRSLIGSRDTRVSLASPQLAPAE